VTGPLYDLKASVPDGLQCLDQRQGAMEAEPSSRVSMPLEIEAVAANPVQASERRVEFLT
jgi:hypothetical protein